MILRALCFMVALTLCISCNQTPPPPPEPVLSMDIDHGLRHVVLFKFKEGTSASDIKRVEDAFLGLPSAISEIRSFEWSNNNVSPEGLDQGFTHCYILTFDNAKDRDTYLPHPAHKEFGAIVGPLLAEAGVLVFDYNY